MLSYILPKTLLYTLFRPECLSLLVGDLLEIFGKQYTILTFGQDDPVCRALEDNVIVKALCDVYVDVEVAILPHT